MNCAIFFDMVLFFRFDYVTNVLHFMPPPSPHRPGEARMNDNSCPSLGRPSAYKRFRYDNADLLTSDRFSLSFFFFFSFYFVPLVCLPIYLFVRPPASERESP